MEFNELIRLFERACDANDWGSDAYLIFLTDGSGEVCSEDNDTLFEFDCIEELVYKLEE